MDVISIDEFCSKLEGVIKGAHLIPNFTVHFLPFRPPIPTGVLQQIERSLTTVYISCDVVNSFHTTWTTQ